MTLIEILVVMTLIGIISSAVMINMRGSIKKAKKFQSNQKARQIEQILYLEVAEGNLLIEDIPKKWKKIIKQSGLFKEKEAYTDAQGHEFIININDEEITVFTQ